MTSGDEVLATLGEALRLSGGTSAIKQALPKVLGGRRTLVVIDGLHGLDVKAAVAVLLWAGPHVSVIVTATGPVGLASEQVLHLRAFSTSGTAQHPSPASTSSPLVMPDASTHRTPPGRSSTSSVAMADASRVLPTPAGPAMVSRDEWPTSSIETAALSSTWRPKSGAAYVGKSTEDPQDRESARRCR